LTKESVNISERALTELEAPFVSIKINAPGLEIRGSTVTFGILKYCVINHGRTPATILSLFETVKSVDLGAGFPPMVEPDKEAGFPMPYGIIAPPNGASEDFPYLAIGPLFGDRPPIGLLSVSDKRPFFMGFVRYADIFGNRFVLGFCFMFDNTGNRWILAGGDDYNYRRKDSTPRTPDCRRPVGPVDDQPS
jgi:hypothetical protein